MSKYTAAQKARDIYSAYEQQHLKLEFISGKWFLTEIDQPSIDGALWGREVDNINRELLNRFPHVFDDINDIERVLDVFTAVYGTTGKWYDSKLVRAAKVLKIQGIKPQPLPFPLTRQQLLIINRLIAGEDEKMFIVTGKGGTGKSTYLNIIKQIFSNDVSACPLSELSGFQLSEALSRRLIASDEISADDLDNKTVKMIISKQEMQVNPKFGKPYQVKSQSGLFYCCNIPPRIDLSDAGMLRRICYYEMNTPIKNPDLNMRQKRWADEQIVDIIMHALSLNTENWEKEFEAQTRYYLLKNNSVYIHRKWDRYGDYMDACKRSGLKPFSEPRWQEVYDLIFSEWHMPKDLDIKPLADDEELPF